MADPFATALGVLVQAPGSVAATYVPANGLPVDLRIIRHQVSENMRHGFGSTIVDGDMIIIRKDDVALPATGDTILIGDEVLHVLAAPILDVEGLSWQVQAAA